MKTKLLIFLFFIFASFRIAAQHKPDLVKYYSAGIDSLVAQSRTVNEDYEEEKTNPAYAKLFVSPVLYSNVLEKAFAADDRDKDAAGSESLEFDSKREAVIDGMMMNVYRNSPRNVVMTENELRSAKPVSNETKINAPVIKIENTIMPHDVAGDMKTNVVRPSYWKFNGKVALRFSQNYISGNWYQGGEKNYYAMLATLDLDMNYNDKDRLSWTNHFDFDLGFATYENGEKLGVRTNTDKLRLESTLGYKLVKTLDIAAKVKAETQSLPFYSSEDVLASAFASPLDANASLGLNYKPNLGNFKCAGLVEVHSRTGEITPSIQYHAFKHYAPYLKRGAEVLSCPMNFPQEPMVDCLVARNPDGKVVTVVGNGADKFSSIQFKYKGEYLKIYLPEQTMTTIILG